MKSRSEIREEMLGILASKTGINTREDGTIVVAIVDAVIDEIVSLYEEVESLKQEAYLSTSTGVYTEMIGELLDIKRVGTETDSELKLRISNAVHTHTKGNRVAIEQAIWDVPGVAGMDFREYGQGTGSFSVFVYPRTGVNQERLLDSVRVSLANVVSEGIRYDVRIPKERRVDLAIVLQMRDGFTAMEKQDIRQRVRDAIATYINSLEKGSVLYINEIIKRSMAIHSNILDVGFVELKTGGIKKSISNTFPETDTRFVSGDITVL